MCAITQPPKISPLALVSAGMAIVRTVSSPRGAPFWLVAGSDIALLLIAQVMPCGAADGNVLALPERSGLPAPAAHHGICILGGGTLHTLYSRFCRFGLAPVIGPYPRQCRIRIDASANGLRGPQTRFCVSRR
jgi:hypothetical protein